MGILSLRPAESSDCSAIWLWANDWQARRWSLNQKPIMWSEHVRWFENTEGSSPSSMLMIELQSYGAIGIVRLSGRGHFKEISINISPKFRGQGFGKKSILLAKPHFFASSNTEGLIAKIKQDNKASLNLFLRAGFRPFLDQKAEQPEIELSNHLTLILLRSNQRLPSKPLI